MPITHCPKCGTPLNQGAQFCSECGYKIDSSGSGRSTRYKVIIAVEIMVALLLLTFLIYIFTTPADTERPAPSPVASSAAPVASEAAAPKSAEAAVKTAPTKKAAGSDNSDRLKRFEAFRGGDLRYFNLHGRVKRLTITLGHGVFHYNFNRDGVLTSATCSLKNGTPSIRHEGNDLVITFPDSYDDGLYYRYSLDGSGRLASALGGTMVTQDNYVYSGFDSRGWPSECVVYDPWGDRKTSFRLHHTGLDQHGNFRSNGQYARSIEYYPVSDFE